MSINAAFLKSRYLVRFSDCDPLGHLNNSRYIDYMLNAREDHLREGYAMKLSDFLPKGIYWVVTGHEIQYRRPALYNEAIWIASALVEMGEHHLRVEFQIWDDAEQELKAVMWTHFTVVDGKTGRKAAHTEAFMTFAREALFEGVLIQEGLFARVRELLK